MVDSKTRLTQILIDGEAVTHGALDVVMEYVDEDNYPLQRPSFKDMQTLEKKPCLLYLERTGFGEFNIVSPAITEVNFKPDMVKVKTGDTDVFIRSKDNDLISKLRKYSN
jgi:hypothetical protein